MKSNDASRELRARFRQNLQSVLELDLAYVGVVNGLFVALRELQRADAAGLANATGMDAGYVTRWCDAAYAFGYLEADGDAFSLGPTGLAMCPDAPDTLMPLAIQAVLTTHRAERAAALMRSGARPGEGVLAERETLLPWFGPMLEATYGPLFEHRICGEVDAFVRADARGGTVVDLGCGNGWYLRALARRFPAIRGIGLDGFDENVAQAANLAEREGSSGRLQFLRGDIHAWPIGQPADVIAMSRALHHVWEQGADGLIVGLREHLAPGGSAVIWEPAWPADRGALRDPSRRTMAFQNLSEHVQGNHFLRPQEIVQAFERAGMPARVLTFAEGNEAVVVATRVA